MKKWQALGSAAALLAALLLGGCSGQQAAATPEQAATPSPAATAEPTPVPAPAGNPLTGLDDADYTGKRPVAVMLRTLDGAQPHWGCASADVLIEGVTELFASFGQDLQHSFMGCGVMIYSSPGCLS